MKKLLKKVWDTVFVLLPTLIALLVYKINLARRILATNSLPAVLAVVFIMTLVLLGWAFFMAKKRYLNIVSIALYIFIPIFFIGVVCTLSYICNMRLMHEVFYIRYLIYFYVYALILRIFEKKSQRTEKYKALALCFT